MNAGAGAAAAWDPVDERQVTALHEAAHAVVAVWFGVQVTEASIRPQPGSGGVPPSLGHVCHWRHPDPRPEDCREGSHWTISWVTTSLAGYVMEELLDVDWYFRPSDWDHARVLQLLRVLTPGRPRDGMRLLEEWRRATRRLLLQESILDEVTAAADLLLEREVVDGRTFYDRLYQGRCRAAHLERPEVRCQKPPHAFGSHYWREVGDLGATSGRRGVGRAAPP